MNNKKIILQQAENKTLSKQLDTLISKINTKIELNATLKDNVVKSIKQTIISIADDNNYWQDIFKAKQQSNNTDSQFEDTAKKAEKMIYESVFVNAYKVIMQQSTDNKDSNKKAEDNKSKQKTNDDTKSKLQAAAKQSNSGGSSDEITLVVSSPDDFEFQNSNGERFESKKSLQQLDGFLKKNINILKDAIDKGKKQDSEAKAKAITEAIQFVQTNIFSFKVFLAEKQNINTNALIDLVKGCQSATWKFVSKQHKFGDRVKNKAEYQKLYYILMASLIAYIAIKNKGKAGGTGSGQTGGSQVAKNKQRSSFDKLSSQEIANLIQAKIKQAGKNPKDKKYLESLLNNKKWNKERTPKYQEALKLLINKA